jgi:hypothetical protein
VTAVLVGALGAALVFILGLRGTRWSILLALGVLGGVAFVLAVYFAAPTRPRSDCSDCAEYGGRYWEPPVVVSFGVFTMCLSAGAAALGRGIRHALDHSI